MDLQSPRASAPSLGQPRRQPGTDLARQVPKEVSARPMHPYLRRLLVGWIGDQVERVARFERLQMAIPIGEGYAVYRSAKVGWPAIRKGRTIPHAG